MATTRLSECNIIAIVDNDHKKQGLSLHSIPIKSPGILQKTQGVILILAALYSDQIKNDITAMGLTHSIDVLC